VGARTGDLLTHFSAKQRISCSLGRGPFIVPAGIVDVILAHPLTETTDLPVSPLLAAIGSAAIVALASVWWPTGGVSTAWRRDRFDSWDGPLSPVQVGTRAVAVVLLVTAIAAGRLGTTDELDNLAPALLVGAAWPLLVALSAVLGPVWRWVDPWDAVARPLDRRPPGDSAPSVLPAAAVAVVWTWYLGAFPDPLSPRAVGTVAALYTLLTVGGCLALGRASWLARGEMFGLLFSWTARLPRGRLAAWQPPRGAEVLLGALAGGLLFGSARRSELWGVLNTVPGATVYASLGLAASCVLGALLLSGLSRRADWVGAPGSVARATVPSVAALTVAVALERNRLFTSVQLLPGLLGDPFGAGWDLLGPSGSSLNPAPLGDAGLLTAQLLVLLVGSLAGVGVLARSVSPKQRLPATVAVMVTAGLSALLVAAP
jgi:hypothetical protein